MGRGYVYGGTVMDRIALRSTELPNGCRIWGGATSTRGYGRVYDPAKKGPVYAHIAAYEAKYGPVPAGMVLDHFACDNKLCCNPDHVRPSTNHDNIARANSPEMVAYREGRCTKGHPRDEEHAYRYKGRWRCRTCRTEYNRKYREDHREPSTRNHTRTQDTGDAKAAGESSTS